MRANWQSTLQAPAPAALGQPVRTARWEGGALDVSENGFGGPLLPTPNRRPHAPNSISRTMPLLQLSSRLSTAYLVSSWTTSVMHARPNRRIASPSRLGLVCSRVTPMPSNSVRRRNLSSLLQLTGLPLSRYVIGHRAVRHLISTGQVHHSAPVGLPVCHCGWCIR